MNKNKKEKQSKIGQIFKIPLMKNRGQKININGSSYLKIGVNINQETMQKEIKLSGIVRVVNYLENDLRISFYKTSTENELDY